MKTILKLASLLLVLLLLTAQISNPPTGAQSFTTLTLTSAGTTATLATGLLTTGTCAAAVAVAVTGTATTSVVAWDYATDPSGVVGYGSSGGLTVTAYATSGNANFRVCNPTAGSITPGAMNLNFRVIF